MKNVTQKTPNQPKPHNQSSLFLKRLLAGIALIAITTIALLARFFALDQSRVSPNFLSNREKQNHTNFPTNNGNQNTHTPTFRYRRTKHLFSPAEHRFLLHLANALYPGHHIFAKVRITDLVEPLPSLSRTDWQKAWNRIAQKHVDFVICDGNTLQPVAVVELDDQSHNRPDRQQRDTLIDSVYQDCGLPIAHHRPGNPPSTEQLRQWIASLQHAA